MTKSYIIDAFETMYDWYDGPLSYTFYYQNDDQLYYGHLIDVEDEDNTYIHWIIPVDESTIQEAEENKIDLRTLLMSSSTVMFLRDFDSLEQVSLADAFKRYRDVLPRPNIFLTDKEDFAGFLE